MNKSKPRPPTCKCGGWYHSTLNRKLYCGWCGTGRVFKRSRRVMVMKASEDRAFDAYVSKTYDTYLKRWWS